MTAARFDGMLIDSVMPDESAEQRDIPATPQVRKLATAIGARGHVTFGGRLAPDAKGFPASAMAKANSGDWRDPEHVRGWVAAVVKELEPLGSRD